ncbi:MAG: PAS domain S-box protein [Sphingosinicella sp.]|nr:PAS domain S-box protein [Sphingosinicella sp.]
MEEEGRPRTRIALLDDAAERYRQILNAAKDGIIAMDPEGCIDGVNPEIEQMFGYSEDNLIGQGIGVLYARRPAPNEVDAFLQLVRSQPESTNREFVGRRNDGTTLLCDVAVTPMQLSTGVHYVAIVRDITERRRIEEVKDQFVATVSHELRTPLTSIAGSLGLLVGGAGGELPATAIRLIKIAHSNSERLVRLINDILDVEKIESGKMVFERHPILLQTLVTQGIDATSGYASQYDVKLEHLPGAGDALVMADMDRLMQVMSNLISNAIKFSPKGETVSIGVEKIESRYRVTVSNKGQGIPEEFRGRIFSRFAQADASSTRQQGGTGLGLNIVREIITRLDGIVGFDSVPGEGASFYFELPAAPGAEVSKKTQVLICTPNAEAPNAKLPAELEGRVRFAGTPDELRNLVDSDKFSAIVLDLQLTDKDRLDIIRQIRQDPASVGTPIILMSDSTQGKENALPVQSILEWLHEPVEGADRSTGRSDRDSGVPRILHVEDDRDILSIIADAFGKDVEIVAAVNLTEARAALSEQTFDVVILDLMLETESGLDLLPELRRAQTPPVPVVIFSGNDVGPEAASAVDAVLTKSRVSLAQVVRTVHSLIKDSG